MGHLLGYARVSTRDQDPQPQIDALIAAGCYRVWTDVASGTRAQRPELAAVLDQTRPGDTLTVTRLDRLGRSLDHLVATVNGLGEREVGFRSLSEAIDTSTAGGRLTFHLFAALAEFQAGLVRENTHAGLAAARARGRHGGRPPVMTATKRAAARQMYETPGYTVAGIAAALGVSRATIYRHLAPEAGAQRRADSGEFATGSPQERSRGLLRTPATPSPGGGHGS